MLFQKQLTPEALNRLNASSAAGHLGIEFTEVGPDYLMARMPVDHRTRQPFGVLHGGASVLLAETLGSVAAYASIGEGKIAVGLDINANHLRAVKEGFVYAKAQPIHVGQTTHVWEIRITNEKEQLICISRITMAILDQKG
ncbi:MULTISPECIES: hotdog fold thioesterase [unclassified Siphonobacter]|uniref:hotdog fold thioesterase n=1 Tax=unclassified Siphonobacter TaxID=2635712 RepID=UPI0027D891FD|nr:MULTISPECIES: hotdog fold thioesterase [unclassified Siphonobacter]